MTEPNSQPIVELPAKWFAAYWGDDPCTAPKFYGGLHHLYTLGFDPKRRITLNELVLFMPHDSSMSMFTEKVLAQIKEGIVVASDSRLHFRDNARVRWVETDKVRYYPEDLAVKPEASPVDLLKRLQHIESEFMRIRDELQGKSPQ